jgi:peroxiredoxin
MKVLIMALFLSLIMGMSKKSTDSSVELDRQAPNFSLINSDSKGINLSDYKGKIVVLEWFNYGCPFVRKHYDSQNMQKLQKKYRNKGVIWLSVVSSAKGKQGYLTPLKAKSKIREEGSHANEVLLDPNGEVGKMYGAIVTPHIFIINKEGALAYNGAIDSIPSYDLSDIPQAKNYVKLALDNLLIGKQPEIKKTRPYGCSVKYE